jgi:hypothetical protein
MGVTMLTALIIQSRGDDVKCEYTGPDKDGMYTGWINLYRDEEYDHPLLDSGPTFKEKKIAIETMEGIVVQIREIDLNPPREVKEAMSVAQQVKNAI